MVPVTAANWPPRPPKGLGTAGRELWKAILDGLEDGWRLDARELRLLYSAARCTQEIAELEAAIARDGYTIVGSRGQTVTHPALAAVRALRLTEQRLLRGLELVDPAARAAALSPRQARAARAAQASVRVRRRARAS